MQGCLLIRCLPYLEQRRTGISAQAHTDDRPTMAMVTIEAGPLNSSYAFRMLTYSSRHPSQLLVATCTCLPNTNPLNLHLAANLYTRTAGDAQAYFLLSA